MRTSNLTVKRIKSAKESAISDLLLQCDSPITFDIDILASDSNKFKLLIKENLLQENFPIRHCLTRASQHMGT